MSSTHLQLVILSGMSGAGKSYALHTLEDMGYYCIDNLPAQLLEELLLTPQIARQNLLAVGIDIRGGKENLQETPQIIKRIRSSYPLTRLVYLYATPEVLFKRYNETRRRHPLNYEARDLKSAIAREAELLADLAEGADLKIDTSKTSVYDLGNLLRLRLDIPVQPGLSILFQSFGFKYEMPSDSDMVFDVRCLPNPYWEPDIRHHSGLETPIIEWLKQHERVEDMYQHIQSFLDYWLEDAEQVCQRAYLTVSIGCTGGRHRSVYIVQRLYEYYHQRWGNHVLVHHRELNQLH
ncbi:RNase adapter RapZ [Thiofilum flexile]|uniref:RNase adapter RapZ n=1 Tax=Thiofilum flexile TaxID=125627 RepID=UPI000366A964|nr:RNase adapter RapZ [Thiofilum flexile]